MADFSNRERELRASFEEDKKDFKVGEQVECFVRLGGLYPARAAALASILEAVCDPGNEPKLRVVDDRIASLVDRWVMPLTKLSDGLLYPGEEIDWWREAEVKREMTFLQGLSNLEIGEMRDEFVKLELGLADMVAVLEKKWATMGEESRRIEELEARACEDMTKIVRDGLHDGTDAWARYGNELRELLAIYMKVPDLVNEAVIYLAKEAGLPDKIAEAIPKISLLGKDYFQFGKDNGLTAKELAAANPELFRDPGMAVSETIQKAMGPTFEAFITAVNALYKNVLPVASGRYYEQLSYLRGLMPNQGAILVSLSQTRVDVDEFLKTNGLDRARALYEKAESALERWADSMPSNGLKTDARAFANDAKEALKRRYERMSSAFGVFVQQNQGRFIGTVSRTIENQLIFTDVWADRSQGLMDIGMDERLREWRKGTTEVSDVLATASSQMTNQLRYLPQDIQESIVSKLNDYWAKMRERVRTEAMQATTTLMAAETRVSDDTIRRDLDRSPLRQRLTA